MRPERGLRSPQGETTAELHPQETCIRPGGAKRPQLSPGRCGPNATVRYCSKQ